MDEQEVAKLAAGFARQFDTSADLKEQRKAQQRRVARARTLLQPGRIQALTEEELRSLFLDSKAFGFWNDKEGEFQRRIERVGLDGLRSSLSFLISRAEQGLEPDDLKEMQRNTGLGLLLSTELATYRYPDRCWIYSARVTLAALREIGCDPGDWLSHGHRSDPYVYVVLKEPMCHLRAALQNAQVPNPDFAHVDLFLWWITRRSVPSRAGENGAALSRDAIRGRGSSDVGSIEAARETHSEDQSAIAARPEPLRSQDDPFEASPEWPARSGRETAEKCGRGRRAAEGDVPYRCRPLDVGSTLQASLRAEGLVFTRWQIAAFFTALQVKGFVILTGISGTGKTRLAQHLASLLGPAANGARRSADPEERGVLFLPVRPDWRDSKALLGYYNPLAGEYVWTPFLRFLLAAAASFQEGDGRTWFVLLDEMNLARVEYYFAELLSVLESGRDEQGWTREPLRFSYPPDARGSLPPFELALPPNLYFVGTVNVDETTHVFSPKVLDRAFSLELSEVDFEQSKSQPSLQAFGPAMRRELRREFTLDGRFTRIDQVASGVDAAGTPELRRRLQGLNVMLRPHDLHFGYRVLDEIAGFLDRARGNHLFRDAGGDAAAFDAAVLMKLLPRLHGSRSRAERALQAVLAWCLDPDSPDHETIRRRLQVVETAAPAEAAGCLERELGKLEFRLPATADRVRRAIYLLYTEGFAAG